MSLRVPFTKMVGSGNDFLLVDTVAHPRLKRLARRWAAAASAWCDRHRGIGADGLLVLEQSVRADVRMRIFNADGSEAEMCGNGSRCAALYWAQTHGTAGGCEVSLETQAGLVRARVRGGRVRVELMRPTGFRPRVVVTAARRRVTGAYLNTGVPHFVVPVSSIEAVDVEGLGRILRRHRAFAPRGANVDFMQPDPRQKRGLLVRTYERGVEAETLACGTGITASAIVHLLRSHPANGRVAVGGVRRVDVRPRSGDRVTVLVRAAPDAPPGQPVASVTLEGVVRRICEGTVVWPTREGSR